MMESIIGLDIGTTGCKATLFDRDGAVRHQAYREYPVGAYTGSISADMIWEQVQQVIRACTAQTPEIAAICATSFGEVVVPVDAAGHTLAEAMLYTNAAAQAQWKRLDEKLGGKRIHMITGHVSHSMYTISNLMRIREAEPEVYAKTAKFLFISSFINYRLTGVAATETSLAARSMAYDVCSGVWSSEIFAAADVEITKMAELIDAGTPLGSVLPEVAAELGMSGKPTVFAGGHDQPCVALGLAAFIMQSSESMISVCFNSSLLRYGGDVAVGAMTVITSVSQLASMPVSGVCQGGQPVMSFNFGAGKKERVKEAFRFQLLVCFGYTAIFWVLMMLVPGVVAGIFTSDATLIQYTTWAMRIYMAGIFSLGIQIACQQSFMALGQAKVSLLLACLRKIILLIPLIFILPHLLPDPVFGVFLAEPVSDILAATITTITFFSRFNGILERGAAKV